MPQPKTSVGKDFQDVTLGRLAERRQVTTIYLRNRMSLRGRVVDFDPYVVLLEPLDGSPLQMVYKSSIVSVAGPPRPRRPMGPPRGGPRPYGSDERRPYGGEERRPYGEDRRPYDGDERPPYRDNERRPYGEPPAGGPPPEARDGERPPTGP